MKKIFTFFTLLLLSFCIFLSYIEAEDENIFLSLEEAMEIAITNNLDIKIARIDANYKRADLDSTKSIFDTILSAEANYEDDQLKRTSTLSGSKALTTNYNFGISKKLTTGTELDLDFTNKRGHTDSSFATINPAHTSEGKITITQPIGKNFFGLIDRGDVKVVKLNIEGTELDSLDRIENALAGTQIEYWNLVFAYRVTDLKKEILERAESLHKIYVNHFARGLAEKPDLYASEANVKIRKIALEEAENEIYSAINILKLSLNLDYECLIIPLDELEVKPSGANFKKNLKEAIKVRRDYRSAYKEIQAQNIDVVLKRNNLWPEIDLVASYARNGVDTDIHKAIDDIFDEDNPDIYFGVSVSLPFENRKAKSKYKKTLLAKEKALITLKKLELIIAGELDERVREVNLDAEKINKWSKIVALQQSKLKEEEKRIKYGRSSSDTLIRFQDDLLDAQLNLAKSFLEYRTSKIDLEVSKNTLLSELSQEDILEMKN